MPPQPTDQPTNNKDQEPYTAVRLRVTHDHLSAILECLKKQQYESFALYPHKAGTDNEHYHICIPGVMEAKEKESLRLALKREFSIPGTHVTIKSMHNGLKSYFFYCGHELATPIFHGPVPWQEHFDACGGEYYVKKTQSMILVKRKSESKDNDSDWQLTYANIVPKAVNHARAKGLTGDLKSVVKDLCEHTRWRPSYHMYQHGVPECYHRDFEFRTGKRQRFDMEWFSHRL